MVNRDGVLARIVLHDARKEGLREKEAGYPEHCRLSIVVPVLRHTDDTVRTQFSRGNGSLINENAESTREGLTIKVSQL